LKFEIRKLNHPILSFFYDIECDLDKIRPALENDLAYVRNLLARSQFQKTQSGLLFYRSLSEKDLRWCSKVIPVVRMLLAIPAGESHCERAFSWAHGFITRLRTRTSSITFEMQMVLYDYFKQANFDWETFLHSVVIMGEIKLSSHYTPLFFLF
jgi:hypothetical protein